MKNLFWCNLVLKAFFTMLSDISWTSEIMAGRKHLPVTVKKIKGTLQNCRTKPIYNPAFFKERFRTIELSFAWEDKFKRLLLRFEWISRLHYALKTLAYTMINLRHFCQP